MSYEIESSTTTEPTKIKCETLWIPLTDKTGRWNNEAMQWFNSRKPSEKK